MTNPKPKSDAIVIKEFFEIPSADAIREIKSLTPQDKQELAKGIRDGSLTY